MLRAIGIAGFVALLASLSHAPATLGVEQGDGSTPRATPEATQEATVMGGTGAVYMVIRNAGNEADRLLGGETDVADVVEIHEMAEVNGLMEMRPLADGLDNLSRWRGELSRPART